MTHDQLTGKYARLRNELEAAYAEPEWSACRIGRIDRIAGELLEIEQLLASGNYRRQAMTVDLQAHAVGDAAGASLQQ